MNKKNNYEKCCVPNCNDEARVLHNQKYYCTECVEIYAGKKKIILHLCADIGSDSHFYQLDDSYEVIKIGKELGVENYHPPWNVWGVIANPVCTEFSTAHGFHKKNTNPDLSLLKHCQRIIKEANPRWWVIENPFNGTMKEYLGQPDFVYHPWEFGSPWTKKTALWGDFIKPNKLFYKWGDVPKNENLYIRPGRRKPGFVYLHKNAINFIPEFYPFKKYIDSDNAFRSLCSQGFAKEFFNANR